eukprot:m.4050 g.4050  ORF g.4050 m.4050 type:complete len:317 (+) comp10148_c0_seq1:20-970(+)
MSRGKNETTEQKTERKAEEAVLKWLRYNVKNKSTTIKGESVDVFTALNAIDKLLESSWATKRNSSSRSGPYVPTREAATKFCSKMLAKGYFFRCLKVEVKQKKEPDEDQDAGKKKKSRKGKDEEGRVKKAKEESEGEGLAETKVKKRKYKIEVCPDDDQVFIDGKEVYVWNYNPTRPWTFAIGIIVVLGGLAASLFPLWPMQMRVGVWYLSTGLASLLGVFFAVALMRHVIFGGVWLITHGTHVFWVLPNLTEDCGFWESFKPFYSIDYEYDDEDDDSEEENDDDEEDDGGEDSLEKEHSNLKSEETGSGNIPSNS